jgi:FAD/FMN-containing dehydrogenase/Fe-S oxidoreductase
MGVEDQTPITRPAEPPKDPSGLARESDETVREYTQLASDLRAAVDGDVRFDEYAQLLYATDGSIYQARPAGVVYPEDIGDVRAAVTTAVDHEVPILPRGAGSSLAGQAVGPGCVVLDMSRHMDGILSVDPDAQEATIQPGVVQDDLDDHLAQYGLKFAPDPASSNRSTVGGGIGNNSTGAHSVRYGITDAYTEEVTAVLPDGSLLHARPVVLDSEEYEDIVSKDDREAEIYETVRGLVEEHEDEIAERYPDLKRRVSGYNLDRVVYENEDGEAVINLAKLYVGAEGTLGVMVEATVGLVSVPEETALALYHFEDLVDAMEAVPEALEFDVSAVELMDDEVFRLAAESDGYNQYVEPIPDGTKASLLLEFDSELHDDFEAAIADTNEHFVENGDAFDVLEAYDQGEQDDIWALRKAAIPLLMSLEGDPKPYPFIEDATVPPAELAEYVMEFEEVLEDHDTSAAYFAHAGSGTLHIRPILNLKTQDDIDKMHSITDDVTDLVLDHHGAFSGEHGDGMARTEFNPKMYGDDLWQAFKEVKTAVDPDWFMHPGNVVYRDGTDDVGPDSERGVGADMRENLRYGASYQSLEPQTELDFSDEGGFSHLVELCNGCGTCRQTGENTMCPTYRASKEEIQATRGRANLLRAAISGELPEEELYSERFQSEVLDLCVGCKGCKSDCPTGVDLAKLKAEVKHEYHQREGTSLRSRLFGNIDRVSAIGSKLAPLSNAAQKLPGSDLVAEKVLGIAPERTLPKFTSDTLEDWFAKRGPKVPLSDAEDKVLLFPDTYTNYSYPEPGKAAVELLEAADIHVEVLESDEVAPSGRAAFSMGLLDDAKERARTNLDALAPYVAEGWSVLFVEPSDAVMFQDEYVDMLRGASDAPDGASGERSDPRADDDRVDDLAVAAYGVSEYVNTHAVYEDIDFDAPAESLAYHGHCNQKALNRDFHAAAALREAGYQVDHLDSSCCGMAGSFGYEAEHYELSKAIGTILNDQVEASDGNTVVAPGASCRSQLADDDFQGERPAHPVEKLRAALA